MITEDNAQDDVRAAMTQLTGEPVAEPVEASADATPGPVETATDATAETAEEKATRLRDEHGRFAKGEKSAETPTPKLKATEKAQAPPKAKAAATPPPMQGDTSTTPPPTPATQTEALKPPTGWKPAAREAWAALPRAVQEEAHRREVENLALVQRTEVQRRFHQDFHQAIAPFQAMLGNAHPIQAARELFSTAYQLQRGAAPAKAQVVARIIQDYGVDIDMLVGAMEGKAPAQSQGPQSFDPSAFAQQVEQRVMQRFQQQQQQAEVQRLRSEVEKFSESHEFFGDVREEMADIIEVAKRRGLSISYEDAYSRACALHPEISPVLEQRKAAERAKATKASTQQSRLASSSVRSAPAVSSSSAQAGATEEDDVRAAIQKLSAR